MQHKVFRIEQTLGGQRAGAPDATLKHALAAARDLIAAQKHELTALIGDAKERRMVRAAAELGAAVVDMDKATQELLTSAESIDDGVKALTAALKTDDERALANAIQDHVVRIYEACNFQDLAGQRIGKVIALMGTIEERFAVMLARFDGNGAPPDPAAALPQKRGLINGPKLDGDGGHASQQDIDRMFG